MHDLPFRFTKSEEAPGPDGGDVLELPCRPRDRGTPAGRLSGHRIDLVSVLRKRRYAAQPANEAPPGWIVLNQFTTPDFWKTMDLATVQLGHGYLLTGSDVSSSFANLTVRNGPPYRQESAWTRIQSWLRFAWYARRELQRIKHDWPTLSPPVLVVTNPPFLPVIVWRHAVRCGWPYAVLVYDAYPDHLVQAGMAKSTNPLVRIWRRLNLKVYGDARAVVSIGQAMASHLEGQLATKGVMKDVGVIAVGADREFFVPQSKAASAFAVENRQLDKFTILYSGNLSRTHRLTTLADVALSLKDLPHLHFLFIGEGSGREQIANSFATRGLTNVTFVERQPWARVPDVFSAADIAVVSQAPGTEHLSVPSKAFAILASGVPILALTSPDSDLARLVEKHDVGLVHPHTDVDAIARALRTIITHPETLDRLGQNARSASAQYGLAHVASQLAETMANATCGTDD